MLCRSYVKVKKGDLSRVSPKYWSINLSLESRNNMIKSQNFSYLSCCTSVVFTVLINMFFNIRVNFLDSQCSDIFWVCLL
jgi:hypothetical protein